ncbi:MAG: zinc ABC transporter substrate-binding protein [Odoribacteraceae bacterium]|jgi:zinc transport system substrate-binding protein|nr:zinc ABC transporter substrate-binding protein [Odoribacteraceae bacterium]
MKILVALSLACACLSCRVATERERNVSVSILPQRYFVERVAGDFVKVNVMIPPGATPESCELTPKQLKDLHNSSIYFAVGYLPFEVVHLYPVLEGREDMLLVKHSDGETLLEDASGEHGHLVDPHVWMSPPRARRMAATVARVLGEKFPARKAYFDDNFARLSAEIDSLDREARRVISRKRHKTFLIYHPALAYLAADYGMEQIAIEHEGKEPSPAHLKAVIDTCRARGVKTIFIQSQFDEQNARAVAREIDGQVIAIDPLNPDWKGEMRSLLSIIERQME